jgi:hypothetical protein
MRVHGNQIDSNIDLNRLYAAAKTEAKLEAERTRKKLLIAGMAGESEDADCVVSLSGEGAPGEDAKQQEAQGEGEEKANQKEDAEDGEKPFSGWA